LGLKILLNHSVARTATVITAPQKNKRAGRREFRSIPSMVPAAKRKTAGRAD
jgi:hypothetical protein